MDAIQKQSIIQGMQNILIVAGARRITIQDAPVLKYADEYYRITFVSKLGFILEWAGSQEEAEKNRFEDVEVYPESLTQTEVLEAFQNDFEEYYKSSH